TCGLLTLQPEVVTRRKRPRATQCKGSRWGGGGELGPMTPSSQNGHVILPEPAQEKHLPVPRHAGQISFAPALPLPLQVGHFPLSLHTMQYCNVPLPSQMVHLTPWLWDPTALRRSA